MKERTVQNNLRNFFCFSLMKTMPLTLQPVLYDGGVYNRMPEASDGLEVTDMSNISNVQEVADTATATGINWRFMSNYQILQNLPAITEITDDSVNTMLCMMNEITHAPMLLQTPDYIPAHTVNNQSYEAANGDRFTLDGETVLMETTDQMTHYHINMAALMQLGNWFDYLRENGVYDNTRIILVADHSWCLFSKDEMILDGDNKLKDLELYYPMLMVKDFDSQEFITNSEFMTNADVPTLAVEGLIENPVNPFTGKPLNNAEKFAHDQYVLITWDNGDNTKNQFQPGNWASVSKDMRDPSNWTFLEEETVLTEHSFG